MNKKVKREIDLRGCSDDVVLETYKSLDKLDTIKVINDDGTVIVYTKEELENEINTPKSGR